MLEHRRNNYLLAALYKLLAKPKKEQEFDIAGALAKRKPLRKTSTAVIIDGKVATQLCMIRSISVNFDITLLHV